MPSNIPPHVAAWAKAHDGTAVLAGNDEWRLRVKLVGGEGSVPVPDADSDAWLAGMVRAMVELGTLKIAKDEDVYKAFLSLYDVIGSGPTLEAAIIKAVLGDDDATTNT